MGYKALVIYNPTAGPWDMTRPLKRLATYLEKYGWYIDLVQTCQSGDATTYAQQAAETCKDIVFVAGGDGTINEVVNGVIGTSTILGIIPVGTGNILAHQIRMPILSLVAPLHVNDIGEALRNSRVQRVDTGIINKRHFLCWAGLGLDAEIAAHIEPRSRYAKHFRTLPYVVAGFAVAAEFRGVQTRIVIEERTFRTRALMAVASNIQLYASVFNIAPHARMDDGLLDLFVFKGLGFSYVLRHLTQLFRGRSQNDPKVMHALARNFYVETTPEVAIHLDGEPFGDTPASVTIAPGNLRLLIPPQAPKNLFNKPPEQNLTE